MVMAEDYARHARDALELRPDDEPVWTALRHALEPAVREQGKDVTAALQTARAVIHQSPSVRSRYQERYRQWRDLLHPEAVPRIVLDQAMGAVHPLHPRLTGGTRTTTR